MDKKCPHCVEGFIIEGVCSSCMAYEVITEGDDANHNCTLSEIRKGLNNITRGKKTK